MRIEIVSILLNAHFLRSLSAAMDKVIGELSLLFYGEEVNPVDLTKNLASCHRTPGQVANEEGWEDNCNEFHW